MNSASPNTLGRALRRFFADHFRGYVGPSRKRIQSYVIRSSCCCGCRCTTTEVGDRVGSRGPRPRRCWISFTILK